MHERLTVLGCAYTLCLLVLEATPELAAQVQANLPRLHNHASRGCGISLRLLTSSSPAKTQATPSPPPFASLL